MALAVDQARRHADDDILISEIQPLPLLRPFLVRDGPGVDVDAVRNHPDAVRRREAEPACVGRHERRDRDGSRREPTHHPSHLARRGPAIGGHHVVQAADPGDTCTARRELAPQVGVDQMGVDDVG